jgi:hypothetical protein
MLLLGFFSTLLRIHEYVTLRIEITTLKNSAHAHH